jgi:hypothetical protein
MAKFLTPILYPILSSTPTSTIGATYYDTRYKAVMLYDGTDWNPLQGVQGATGSNGVQGTTGLQGTTGSQGIQGIIGSQGITGTTGVQGATGTQGVQGVIGDDGFVSQPTAPTNTSLLWLDTASPADTTILSFNAQVGTAYTLGSGDVGNLVTASNASAITITVPPSVFSTGQIVNVQQTNTGQVTFAQGVGVTITSTGATSSAPKIRTQYSAVTVICTGTNTFTIIGDTV